MGKHKFVKKILLFLKKNYFYITKEQTFMWSKEILCFSDHIFLPVACALQPDPQAFWPIPHNPQPAHAQPAPACKFRCGLAGQELFSFSEKKWKSQNFGETLSLNQQFELDPHFLSPTRPDPTWPARVFSQPDPTRPDPYFCQPDPYFCQPDPTRPDPQKASPRHH